MSIIEKAVGTLPKLKDSDLNEDKQKQSSDSRQRSIAERAMQAQEQAAEPQGEGLVGRTPTSTSTVEQSQQQAVSNVDSESPVVSESGGFDPEETAVEKEVSQGVNSEAVAADMAEPQVHELVHIPVEELVEKGMVTHSAPRSTIAEEYRVIKRPLLMNISGKSASKVDHPNLIMVTSSLQGEGKTFSALNLAMSMSMEKGKTVLFVDGDIAKASAGRLLGVPDSALGLIDVLQDEVGIEDVLVHTDIPNLKIIPAGQIHDHSTELLASQKMLSLANEISERYHDRIIIFDSPPLLLTTEARVLANAMGQIVFVVAAEQTSTEALHEALEYLSQDKIIGMVLNKAKRNLWDKHRYGYGYGYGYGSNRNRDKTVE